MAYTPGFEIPPFHADYSGTSYVSLEAHAFIGNTFVVTPKISMGTFYLRTPPTKIHFAGFEFAPEMRTGILLSKVEVVKTFTNGNVLYWFAYPSNSNTIVTEAAVDPLTGPYTKIFYPSFLMVSGKLLDFTGAPRYGRTPLSVQFTPSYMPMVSQYYWSFGDGNYSYAQTPTNIYQIPGVYDVRMQVKIGDTWYLCFKREYIIVWPGGLKVSETNKTYRYALPANPEQGRNWSELGGSGWPQPESRVGTFRVFTSGDQPQTVITDARTGLHYTIASRNGPVGSGIVKRMVDAYTSTYGGVEIPWSVKLKAHTGDKKHKFIKHLVTHLYFSPMDKNLQNTDGHDANGYRLGQEITLHVYVNDQVVIRDKITNIPIDGDYVFSKLIEGRKVQLEIIGTTSEIKLTGASTKYELLDKRGTPTDRTMTEQLYQQELRAPIFWFSRGPDLVLNRATGVDATGLIFGSAQGPDGISNSAMVFSATSTITSALREAITADYSLIFSVSNITATTQLFTIGTMTVSIALTGGVYFLQVNDGGTIYSQRLGWTGTGWAILSVTRSGSNLLFYESGTQLNTLALSAVNAYSGNIVVPAGNIKRLFDVRGFNSLISSDCAAYYYDELVNRNGTAILPMR